MYLRTFGIPGLSDLAGEEKPLPALSLSVLAYLVVGGPRERRHLAELFWKPGASGRNSLSTTLSRIRSRAPEGIEKIGSTVVGSTIQADTHDLTRAAKEADIERLRELYVGPFLGQLSLRRPSLEFEQWVLDTRATFAATVEAAVLKNCQVLVADGQVAEAAEDAAWSWTIIARDGLITPELIPSYVHFLNGNTHPLLQMVRREATDLGIELDDLGPSLIVPAQPRSEPVSRPTQTGGRIFGFEAERCLVQASVEHNRLTTIVGLGGSGKTTLCADVVAAFDDARSRGLGFDQTIWVDLRPVTATEFVPSAVHAAVGRGMRPNEDVLAAVPDDCSVLLVFDHFEHVIEARSFVELLLTGRPQLRVLVTSRAPLELPEESLVALGGLAYSEEAAMSPAEELFIAAAARAGATTFDTGVDGPGADDRQSIRRICEQVGGLPLALELAGSWASVLPPKAIADTLEGSSELLTKSASDSEHSMLQILEQKWLNLTTTQRQALLVLCAFPGGCLGTAAIVIDGLSLDSLSHLIRHSLASVDETGRFTLHPLIERHAQGRLAEDPAQANRIRTAQAAQCIRVVEQWAPALRRSNRHEAIDALGAEVANIEAAWNWCLEVEHWDAIRQLLWPLRLFLVDSGQTSIARRLFLMALQAHRDADPEGAAALLGPALSEASAWISILTGDVRAANDLLDDAEARMAAVASFDGVAETEVRALRGWTLRTRGVLNLHRGEVAVALQTAHEGIEALGSEAVDPYLFALLHEDLGQGYEAIGDEGEAERLFRQTLERGRELEDPHMVARSYLTLAKAALIRDPARALAMLNEGERVAHSNRLDQLASFFPGDRGRAHLQLDRSAAAYDAFDDGVKAVEQVGHLLSLAHNLVGRAEASRRLGRREDACTDLRSAIRISVETNSWTYVLWAAVVAAELVEANSSASSRAASILRLVATHEATEPVVQEQAMKLLAVADSSGGEIPGDHQLDDIAERVLALLTY